MSTPFDIPITAPSGGGGLPQVAIVSQANDVYSSSVPSDATGVLLADFEILITPTSATQKVYLSGVINGEWASAPQHGNIILYRNGTSLAPTSGETNNRKVNGQFLVNYGAGAEASVTPESCPFSFMDEPETTAEIKYEVHLVSSQSVQSFYFNRPAAEGNQTYFKRFTSSFSAQCFEP